jgi:hypothetical protein
MADRQDCRERGTVPQEHGNADSERDLRQSQCDGEVSLFTYMDLTQE